MAGEFLTLGIGGAREHLLVRDEVLPPTAKNDCLLILSYSGNTTEALSLWEEGGKRGLTRGAVSSGGELLRRAGKERVSHCRVPSDWAPRGALGFLLRGAWAVAGADPEPDWVAVASHLRAVKTRWVDGSRAPAAAMATRITQTVPIVLAGEPLLAVAARRWVADLGENAKLPGLLWEMPEAAHNQIMAAAAEAPRRDALGLFALGSPVGEGSRVRWEATLKTLDEHGAGVERIDDPHPDPWIRALGLAYLGDWVSVLAAEHLGIEASNLSLMDDLKHRLGGKGDQRS